FGRDAESRGNLNSQNVVGKGPTGGTGLPTNLRGRGEDQTAALDCRTAFQRRCTAELTPSRGLLKRVPSMLYVKTTNTPSLLILLLQGSMISTVLEKPVAYPLIPEQLIFPSDQMCEPSRSALHGSRPPGRGGSQRVLYNLP